MSRSQAALIILLFCLIVLTTVSLFAWPLITGVPDERVASFINTRSESILGAQFVDRYSLRIDDLASREIGAYKELNKAPPQRKEFVLAGLILSGLVALFVSLVSLTLFIINILPGAKTSPSRLALTFLLLLIILNGTIIRLLLAAVCYGNFDMASYEIVVDIVAKGGNVYAETYRYPYSPLWFTVLMALKKIQLQLPQLSFHLAVKSFLCGVDLLTLLFLLLIAAREKISLSATAVFFYLNPVSFLVTGYHGQFENLAVLMVVVGIWAYLKFKQRPLWAIFLLWFFATFGMIVKHNVFYQLIICLHAALKRYYLKLLLLAASVAIFLLLFIPYWQTAGGSIINHVFKYSSTTGQYGITTLITSPKWPGLKYMFIAGMCLFPLCLKRDDIIGASLMGMLFFLVFITGVAIQYFVLPVALGALRCSRGFLGYSLAASLLILGSKINVYLPPFHMLDWNIVWLGVLYWFILQGRTSVVSLPNRRRELET